ncbi:translation initiation factor IF-3 [Patescibacteria group bacterium]|nr:translation initiation factor IF-3 [Patescibacteria group bacterium]
MLVNERIKASKIRLIDAQGKQMGILSLEQALEIARKEGVDLVEVAPQANPPVCRLLDYGKLKYQLDKKRRKAKKKQFGDVLKEIRLSYHIGEHDLETKIKKIYRFLQEGYKVKVSVRFKGRERIYRDEGKYLLEKVVKQVEEVGKVESRLSGVGGRIEQYLIPK